MRITEHKGFEITHFRPGNKTHFKIYRLGRFKQTCTRLREAKNYIDFCLKHGLWT